MMRRHIQAALLLVLYCASSCLPQHAQAVRLPRKLESGDGGGGRRALLQQGLNIQANTPAFDSNGQYTTFVGLLATALLGQGTPGLFWGTVPADSVNAACDYIVNTGSYQVPATITGYGRTVSTSMSVSAIGGCRADSNAPVGVQAVFTDDIGERYAIICDSDNTWSLGCGVYVTGDAVNELYARMHSSRRRLQGCDGRADCDTWGPGACGSPGVAQTCPCMCGGGSTGGDTGGSTGGDTGGSGGVTPVDAAGCGVGTVGAVAGGVGAGLGCLAATIFAPLCWAAGGIAMVAGSLGSCTPAIADSCFPGHALVSLRDGTPLPMHSLQLGQEVAVRRADGSLAYEPVYAWGHREQHTLAEFVQLDLTPLSATSLPPSSHNTSAAPAQLELTPGHFAMVAGAEGAAPLLKRAADVAVGDVMWVLDAAAAGSTSGQQGFSTWHVAAVRRGVHAAGIYNPYTLSGNIIVNGIAASCHSEWFADAVFDTLGLSPQWLPGVYQATLAPVRALWATLGTERYIKQYNRVDAQLGVTQQCVNRGLLGALGAARLVSAGAVMAMSELASDVLLGTKATATAEL